MPLPYLWDAFAICEVPDKANRTCCGLTRRGSPCKLYVTEEVHQMGVKKLNALSCEAFDLRLLHARLQEIVPHFLCARWHRQLQADDVRLRWTAAAIRNSAQVDTSRPSSREERELSPEARVDVERTSHNPSMSPDQPNPAQSTTDARPLESSHVSSQRKIEILLLEEGLPLDLLGDDLTVISIETKAGDEVLFCLKDYRLTSSLGDDTCGICLGTEQNGFIVLKCGRCTSCVHIGCMSTWLQSLSSKSKSSCLICKSDAPFDAYFDERTVEAVWNQRQRRASAADHQSLPTTIHDDNEQPPVDTMPSTETSSTPADAVLDTAGPSTHPVRQESEHVEYPSLPVASASQDPPSLRRSGRKGRAPERYGA